MRATKGYVAGVGTTTALVAAIACAFAVLSAVVAVRGWSGTLSSPQVATLDGTAATPSEDLFAGLGLSVDPASGAHGVAAVVGAGPDAGDRGGAALPAARPLADFQVSDGAAAPVADRRPEGGAPGVSAAGSAAAGAGASAPAVPVPGTRTPAAGGGSVPPPSSPVDGAGSSEPQPGLGGAVTQVTSGVGTAVTQTGQQLGGAVQGATAQLGGAVGQVSPTAGQVVTQTGQAVGGAVSGATGTVGQVVQGTGAAVGGILGGLGGGRTRR